MAKPAWFQLVRDDALVEGQLGLEGKRLVMGEAVLLGYPPVIINGVLLLNVHW